MEKQEVDVTIGDVFYQIKDTSTMLRFLIEASYTNAAWEGPEFTHTARKMLIVSLDRLNDAMKNLAENYHGLTYNPVVSTVSEPATAPTSRE